MHYSPIILCLLVLLASPRSAQADVQRVVTSGRVLLGDLVPNAPAEVRGIDVGPAPPGGSSRLFPRSEIQALAQRAGVDLAVTESVRIARATTRWSQTELAQLLEAKLVPVLPPHAHLIRIDAPKSVVTSTNARLSRVSLGQLPHRTGPVTTTCVLELTVDGQLEQRLVVRVALELTEPPVSLRLPPGTPITLIIRLGSAQVSTAAVTLEPTSVGSTALLRVIKTRKSLRAKLVTAATAEALAQ